MKPPPQGRQILDKRTPAAPPPAPDVRSSRLGATLAAIFFIGGAVAIFYKWPALSTLVRDQGALQAFVTTLGWWGPIGLISINVLQMVVAPIPGYAVYLGAGFLYGAWWGGLYGSIGLLAGGMTAMFVGRHLGRPLVERIVGRSTLTRWESVTHSNSMLVWGALLLSPVGDAPFLLAGLSSVSYRKIFVLSIVTRVPAAMAAAAIGAGVLNLAGWEIMALILVLAVPLILLSRQQATITAKLETFLNRRTAPKR